MKKFWFSLALLLVTITVSIICVIKVFTTAEKTVNEIEEIKTEVRRENYMMASKKIETLNEHWDKDSDILSIIIHHEALDNVKLSVALMKASMIYPEIEAENFWMESTRAISELESIKETELPNLANVL